MYKIVPFNSFKRDVKRCKKRNYDFEPLEKVLNLLRKGEALPPFYKPHQLKGNFVGRWECHLKPDWILIWKQNDQEKIIYLDRLGTHSDLFK